MAWLSIGNDGPHAISSSSRGALTVDDTKGRVKLALNAIVMNGNGSLRAVQDCAASCCIDRVLSAVAKVPVEPCGV